MPDSKPPVTQQPAQNISAWATTNIVSYKTDRGHGVYFFFLPDRQFSVEKSSAVIQSLLLTVHWLMLGVGRAEGGFLGWQRACHQFLTATWCDVSVISCKVFVSTNSHEVLFRPCFDWGAFKVLNLQHNLLFFTFQSRECWVFYRINV